MFRFLGCWIFCFVEELRLARRRGLAAAAVWILVIRDAGDDIYGYDMAIKNSAIFYDTDDYVCLIRNPSCIISFDAALSGLLRHLSNACCGYERFVDTWRSVRRRS